MSRHSADFFTCPKQTVTVQKPSKDPSRNSGGSGFGANRRTAKPPLPARHLIPYRRGTSVEIDTGNTAWILVSSALVLLMTPGLAMFYGGLNRSKGVLNMMMMSLSSIGLISILWLFYGFSIAFGDDVAIGGTPGLFGNIGQFLGTMDLSQETFLDLPLYVFMAFQMMFAIITVALISGALSDRTRFAGWLLFAAGWFTLAYAPIAHMVWGGGFIGGHLGVIDFAGGTAVHINAGAAALALAIVIGRRIGYPKESFKPHNVPLVLLGAALLWFGWFGFNAGSAGAVNEITGLAFINTQVATAAAVLGWIIVEWIKNGKPTIVGGSSGAIAGLVAITPSCSTLLPWSATLLGLAAGALCALAVGLKYRLGYDDSLDVVGVHFVGGWIGTLWIGIFAQANLPEGSASLIGGGGLGMLGAQAAGAAIASVWSFVVALVVGYVVKSTVGLRLAADAELEGIDINEHKESAYDFHTPTGGGGAFAAAGIASSTSGSGGTHATPSTPQTANV